MKKKQVQRSGVVRCQKCFKYGHYTYQCQNETVYRYRPSRTMQYKQKLQVQVKASKPPKVSIVNPDYKRRVVDDGPSSDSNEQVQPGQVKLQKQQVEPNKSEQQQKNKNLVKGSDEVGQQEQQQQQVQEQQQSESSSSSSSSDSSSQSQSSSSQKSDEGPRKIKQR